MERLGKTIAADRQRLGISQHDLAKRVGVSQQSVAKWEAGKSYPRGKRLTALATILGKTSQTAAVVTDILHGRGAGLTAATQDETTMSRTTPETTQTQALTALAQAALQLAQAAQTIADTVQRIGDVSEAPDDKSHH